MIVHTCHVRCDVCGEAYHDLVLFRPWQFDSEEDALKSAKDDGWYIHNGVALCPECKQRLRNP